MQSRLNSAKTLHELKQQEAELKQKNRGRKTRDRGRKYFSK